MAEKEIKSKSPRRRSKRRSSFAASRINFLKDGNGELHSAIDPSKTKEERLSLLMKLCLEHAMNKMETDRLITGDFATLRREVEEDVLRKIADMEVDGLFKEATEKKRTIPNPINMEIDAAIEDLKNRISRLQEESNHWDRLIKSAEDKFNECEERKTKECNLTELDIPDTLKAKSSQYLCNRLEYSNLLADLDESCQRHCLMIHEHARIVKKVNTALELVSSPLKNRMLEYKTALMPDGTPRREIQFLLTFPTPR